MKDNSVRTRFAPSPTGFMHVGNVRTAIFAWLYAKAHHGRFILRIEDTDKDREVEGSIDHIIESLDWLGLTRDEGPRVGGGFGPYKQSERLDLYKEYAQKLIDTGRAYADPFSSEEVDEFRQKSKAEKKPFLYRDYRPDDIDTPEDWYGKVPIRFKINDPKRSHWQDIVRGELSAGEEALDDFVIIKSDGYPTYNFAHVIDDHEMEITHVIRGEEFIPSVPKFLALMEALDFKPPAYITAPPILNANGGKKLSKRDGAKDVLEYRDEGFTPDAIANFLASMGWNDGSEREVYTLDEMVVAFDADRIQKSGAKFDETKLDWLSWQHSVKEIEENASSILKRLGMSEDKVNTDFAKLAATKARNTNDFLDQYNIYAESRTISLADFDLSNVDKSLDQETAFNYVQQTIIVLEGLDDYSATSVETALRAKMEELGASPRAYLNLIRWAISNSKVSPNLFEMISIIGKDEIIYRLNKAL
jgi:glutamyl-tRNA synthetase